MKDFFKFRSELSELSITEGKLTVQAFTGGSSPKKFGLKVKKLRSSMYGGDDVEISGPDAKLVKFAIANLGVDKKVKSLKDAQKDIDDQF